MKVRIGFVSNSSSSSFICVATTELHKQVMKELSPYEKAVIEAIGVTKTQCFGRDAIQFGYVDDASGSFWDYFDDGLEDPEDNEDGEDGEDEHGEEDEEERDPSFVLEKYCDIAKRINPNEVFSTDM